SSRPSRLGTRVMTTTTSLRPRPRPRSCSHLPPISACGRSKPPTTRTRRSSPPIQSGPRGPDMSAIATMTEEPTVATVWQAVAGSHIDDGLLGWPPDVFALTEVLLERSAAYRFALSPPGGNQWPPARVPGWADAVADAGRRWSAWAEDREGALPELLREEWNVVRDAVDTSVTDLTDGQEWRTCEALLTLHAIADEACAGLGVALDSLDGGGFVYRARGRELLANTGSLARIPTHLLRVLPRLRTPPNG